VKLFVDTSVWSLALRRDTPSRYPEVSALTEVLRAGGSVFTTGIVLQELLQGFDGAKAHNKIVSRFGVLPFVVPDRKDHVDAALVRNACRRKGIAVGTIDALLAQLCIRHDLVMLTTDRDFTRIARVRPLKVWKRN
jgi:predicted nucleic acid-binding protein